MWRPSGFFTTRNQAVPPSVRWAPIGLALATAAALGPATAALAFDKTETEQPVAAGRGYVYFIREVDAQQQPLAGRTVAMSVGTAPGPDASVAPSDAGGHVTGAAGRTATERSGADGLVYFVLRTSATPGVNQFTWSDTAYTGQVLVTGTPPPSASAGAGGAAGAVRGSGRGSGAPPARGRSAVVPPLAAGIAAGSLVWLGAPVLLARRRRRAAAEEPPMPSLNDRLPISG
jgi:hypothetical protein